MNRGYTHKKSNMYAPSFASGHTCLLSKSRSFRQLLRAHTMIYSLAAVNHLGAHGSIGQVQRREELDRIKVNRLPFTELSEFCSMIP